MKKLLTFLTLLMLFFGVGWAESVTTLLDADFTGVTSTSYKNWEKARNGVTFKGNSAKRSSGAIQMRSNNNSGIVSTTSIGTIKKIAVTWDSNNTADRTIDIYGNNSAYSSPSDLYNSSSQGTKIGSLEYSSTTDTELTVTDSYAYIGLRSTTGAIYISQIIITWEVGGSTVETVATPTFSPEEGTYTEAQNVTISCSTSGATIHYTTDGNDPTTSSSVYSNAIPVSSTTTIKAMAVKSGMNNSDVASATYTINSSGSSSEAMTFTPTSNSAGTLENAPNSSVTAAISGFSGFTSGQGAQRTSNTSPATISFSNLPSNYKVMKIEVEYCTNTSKGQGTISATLNDNAIGNSFTVTKPQSGGTTLKTATLFEDATGLAFNGNLVVSTIATENSIYIYQVRVYYEEIAAKTYDVTVTQAEGGTITASPVGEKVVDAGDKITVTATPDAGYELTGWTITGASESTPDANNQITATGNVTITASFSKVELAINRVITTNGENNTAGGWLGAWEGCSTVGEATDATGYTVKAKVGSTITFKAGTNNTYQILTSNVTAVDGENSPVTLNVVSSDGTGTVFSFTMPGTPVTITANFTNYRGDLRLAGHVNSNTTWRTGNAGPKFTYNSTGDKYTIRAYFTGQDDNGANDYFFLTLDGVEKHPQADQGNYYIYDLNGGAMPFNLSGGSSNNFGCAPGVYDIEINGQLTSMKFTKIEPTISFNPAAGEIEQGTSVSATSNLTSLIAGVKSDYDSDANGEVTVGVNTDNGSTWNESTTLNTIGAATVYGKAYIGNINVTGNAAYTVVKANMSNKYQLATTLTPGKKYIIVSEAKDDVMGAYVSGNTRYTSATTSGYSLDKTNHIVTLNSGSDVTVLTLGGTTGEWTLLDNDQYLTWNSGNTLDQSATATTNASKWNITLNEDNAVISNLSDSQRQIMRNSGSAIFACYTGTQTAVQLYQQMVEEVKDYTITYAEVTGGSATGATEANEGEQITVTVTANDGYAATGITVNPSVEVTDNHDGTYTFTMPASNVTVTPSFAQAYDITYVAEPAAGGLVTGVASAVYDARVEVTVTPNADYQLSGTPTYTYNGITQQLAGAGTAESPYYFNMPGYATTVTANFVKIPHSISVVSTHGDVTGIPATATSGTEVTFTVTPNAGYVVSSVTGTFNNGNSSLSITDNGDGTYTFSMPAYDVAITVTYFASEDYELLTDLADINAEDTYLIVGGPVAGGYVNVMGKKTDNSTMGFTALTSSNYDSETGIITSNENMAVVNFLVSNGTYAIHTAEGYVNESSVTASAPFYWTIELDETTSRAQIIGTNKHFSYNNSAPRWKAYNGEQGASYIFKLANKNKVKRPSITGAAGEFLGQYNFIGKDSVTMACATDGATIEYSLNGGNTWQSYSEAFEISTDAAGNTVDVMARATKTGMEPSEAVTATFTCIKPTAPTFGTNEAGAYVNPVFVYPKSALKDRRAYGEESVSFCYTTDGTDADASSVAVATSNSNGYYIVLDDNATLSVVTVINGIASDPAGGEYTFSVDAPAFSLAGGSYDGNQQTRLSTATKTQQNNLSWNTVIYYTTGNTEFEFNATTGEVTSEGWVAYDPTGSPYIDILAANGTTTIKAVTLSNYFKGQTEYRASDVTTKTYVLTAANLAVTISPAAGTYVNAQNVTLGVKNEIGDYIIYYTTDGSDPSGNNAVEYTGTPITVDHDMTIKVYAMDSRQGDGGTATAEATYKIGIQPVVYSPFPGTIYKGDDDDINVEMFSVTPNAKIYYTVAEGEGNYPDDPTTSSTLYSEPIPLETGKVYNFKAIAVVGSLVSTVTPGTFTVQAKGSGWLNVKEMNEDDNYTYADQLDNPVQVVYMSTWRNNGTKPEFCFVRDNSGYGLVYFGGSGVSSYNDYTKFQMGDWLAGGTVKGKLNVWSSSFINELGTSSGSITDWPDSSLGNTAILPEETTNKAITDGWTYDGAYTGSDYEDYIDPDKNLFGHYVHMRKNTITNVTGAGGGDEKHIGIITDQSGVPLNYYDGFYLFSGYNGSDDYNQAFFNSIQSKGGTFDVYAIVYFYGPNAKNASYSNAPYEIFPIDFEWIYKPLFNIETGTYHEPQTISLTCETEGAQIWYKTSEMEAYELYTGPFEVDATTTIESYSTIPSKYNDVLESVINSITVTIGTVEAPVITEQSVVKTVGESVTTDITCTSEGATIYYTTDGSDPKTSDTRIEYTIGQQLTFDETTTVRAIAVEDGYYSVEAESRTYTFVKSNGIEYTLVTEASQLNENSVYVIVNKANNMAMSTNQKPNNRDAAGVMFKNAEKTIVYGNDDLAQFTLKKTGNNWYIQTNNSSSNGYLSVGNGNTLLTSATPDGNAEATINIDGTNADVDKANEAHISFIYNNETTRFMRYWNRDHLFNTYTTETNAPVFLYYIEATPLATIEKEGTVGKQYTVADQLLAVYADADRGMLWCKDQGNVSIAKTEKQEGQIDYMMEVTKEQTNDWDQSNWVVLQFSTPNEQNGVKTLLENAVGSYIKPATIMGTYTDALNYTITMADNTLQLENDGEEYVKNLYCTANFLPTNLNLNGGQGAAGIYHGEDAFYFFMNPKVQEICEITYAEWDGDNTFIVPLPSTDNPTQNDSKIDGAFTVDWKYNTVNTTPDLKVGESYKFWAIVQRTEGSNYLKASEPGRVPSTDFIVYPLNLVGGEGSPNIITAINTINTDGGREVESVKYVNVAGQVSDSPFSGVNIVVTEYTDGSRTTTKVLRK